MDADPAYRAERSVLYQGMRGAFSEDAARRLIGAVEGDVRFVGLPSLDAVRAALQQGRARRAVVPVRNSIAGDVPGADTIVHLSGARVTAEISLPIRQCLVAPPGVTLDTLRRVVSHPMAIAQCRRFLDARPWLRVEPHDDTAGALRMLMEMSTPNAAAIASERAVDVWGGTILQRAIQDDAENLTTFVLVEVGTGLFSTDPSVLGTGLSRKSG